MNAFRDFIDRVKEAADLAEVVASYGVPLRKEGGHLVGSSPWRQSKSGTSFKVYPAGRWHDFGSAGDQEDGDVIDFVCLQEDLSFKEAAVKLGTRYGVPAPGMDDEALRQAVAEAEERAAVQRVLTLAAEHYHSALPDDMRERYRVAYGLTDETIDRFKLGWADGGLYKHLEAKGVSRELALKTGLFLPGNGRPFDFYQARLMFPYWSRGRVAYFIGREVEGRTPDNEYERGRKYKKLLTHKEKHPYVSPTVRNDTFYGEDTIRGAEEILIAEGVADCIAAIQAGCACVSPVTVRFSRRDHPKLIELTKKAARVVICNDNEDNKSGEEGARATAAALHAAGRDVRIATLPRRADEDKVDIADYLRTHSADDFRAVLDEALRYVEYLIEQIPPDAPGPDLERELPPILAEVAKMKRGPGRDWYVDTIVSRFEHAKKRTINAMVKAEEEIGAGAGRAGGGRAQPGSCPEGDRHEIPIDDCDDEMISVQAWSALLDECDPLDLFRDVNGLIRVDRDEFKGEARLKVTPFSSITFRAYIGGRLVFTRCTDPKRGIDLPCPRPVTISDSTAQYMMAKAPARVRPIRHMYRCPVWVQGPNTPILASCGYYPDVATLIDAGTVKQVEEPTNLTNADVAAAVELLRDLLCDFPFDDDGGASFAHALALALSIVTRPLIDGPVPMFYAGAPTQGTGKGKIIETLGVVATGESVDIMTPCKEDEEWRKRIPGLLREHSAITMIDNVSGTLDSEALTGLLTARYYKDRRLGYNDQTLIYANNTVWCVTGNNVRFSRDLERRVVTIRLVPDREDPHNRSGFKYQLPAEASRRRVELLTALHTLVAWWVQKGQPAGSGTLGSFEEWVRVVGGILDAADVEGFLGNRDTALLATGTDFAEWAAFLGKWAEHSRFGLKSGGAATAGELAELAKYSDLMDLARGNGTERSQATRFAKALLRIRDRTLSLGGRSVRVRMKQDNHSKQALWCIEEVDTQRSLDLAPVPAPGQGGQEGFFGCR